MMDRRADGRRSQRDDQYGGRGAPGQKPQTNPNAGEPREREDGSWDPPSPYKTWADYDFDWDYDDDDDDIDADTEGVVDERDEYPDDWGGQLGAGEGLRSFREFDRMVREFSPKERERVSREASEEYERLVQQLMDEHQERADLMARLYP